MKVISGTSNPALAAEVCKYLGIEPVAITAKAFSDGETQIEIHENVRGRDVFVIQSTCPPVNDNLMQLLIIIDALKRASARRISAVIPYYGYARQDRKVKPRVPISAKLVADLITVAGANKVVSMDLHAGQIQGYFNIPVDNIFAAPILLTHIRNHFDGGLVIVSPDAGELKGQGRSQKRLDAGLAIIDKRRDAPNVAEAMNIIGEVENKTVVILDDMVDTAGTVTQAAGALHKRGALKIYACCTHPILSGPAIERIEESPLNRIVVTNTVPLNEGARKCSKITVLSVAELLGESIKGVSTPIR